MLLLVLAMGGMRRADIKKNPTEKELQEVRKANPWLEEL